MDLLALGGLAAALVATLAAWIESSRGRGPRAAAWLALAALCLRAPAAWHWWLQPWDERYHALVAKNALESPLVPRLVAQPLEPPAPEDWRHAHVWLHKPPLTTWLMAGSMALFGANEVAARVPSVLLAALGVLVTFALGRRFVSERAAVAAAAFQAWNGFGILLSAGLRATDHVDVAMTFAIGLGVLQALRASEALAERRPRAWLEVAFAGALTGAAWLVKDAPAAVVPAVLFVALCARDLPWSARVAAPALALGVALVVVAPWQIYTASAFPELAAVARARGARYFASTVDRRGGEWWVHFAHMTDHFGAAAPLALVAFVLHALRRGRETWALLAWLALVYGAFTLAATKMEAYPYIASPALFVAFGWFLVDGGTSRSGAVRATARRVVHAVVALALVVGAGFGAWSALDPLRPRPRDPMWAQELRWLGAQVAEVPAQKRVVFGVPRGVECMFYVDATCVGRGARDEDVARAQAAGFTVVDYGGTARYGVVGIPYDSRTLGARRLASVLRARQLERPLIWNARDAADLSAYLKMFVRHARAFPGLPEPSRRLSRKLARGDALVVLVAPGQELPEQVRAEFPTAIALEDAQYAQPPR